MNKTENYNVILKRFLKKRVKVTEAVIVVFLITGSVGLSIDISTGSVTNSDIIRTNGDHGMVAQIAGKAINTGVIINSGKFGMFAHTGGEVTNENGGYILNTNEYGMVASGSTSKATNNGFIMNYGHSGMQADNGGNALNDLNGFIANIGDYGMSAIGKDSVARNTGKISNNGNLGMFADGEATAINNNSITNNGMYGMYADNGGTIKNGDDWNFSNSNGNPNNYSIIANNGSYGMVATNDSSAINNYLVANKGSYGMYTDHGRIDNNNIVANEGKYGMIAEGRSYANNHGLISNKGDYGIYASNGAIASNYTGGIVANEGKYGMVADGFGTLNLNNYIVANTKNYGMYAVNGGHIINSEYGIIANKGNFGMTIVDLESSGENYGQILNEGNIGVLLVGNATFRNEGVVSPGNNGSEDGKIALLGGTGDNTLYLKGEMEGVVHGGAGTNTLIFYGSEDEGRELSSYGDFKSETFSHLGVQDGKLTVDTNILLGLGKPIKNVELIPDADGVITSDKFNGFEYTNEDKNWINMSTNDEIFNGELVIEKDATLTLSIGENRASTLAASSISGDGTIGIKALDQIFVTNTTRIEVTNILLSNENGLDVEVVPETLKNGWTIEIINDGNGTYTTTLLKKEISSVEDSLLGGYSDSVSKYTQSNVDMLNSMKIRDAGYGYARKNRFHEDSNVQFAEIFGQAGKYDGSTGSNYDYDTFGITGGTFRKLDNNWTAGISYGYASSDVDYKKNGSEDVDSLGINGYLSHKIDNWLVTGSLGYSWSKHDLTRKAFDRDSLVDPSIIGDNRLTADFDSHTFNVGLEVGYNYALNENISLYPYAGLDYVWYNRDAYTESGDGNLALKVDKVDYGVPMSKLGLMYEAAYDKWNFMADLAWVHNFYDSQDKGATKANFKNLNSSAKFNILGLDLGKGTGVASLGVAYDFTDDFTVGAEYSGFVRDGEFGNKGAVNFSYKW